MISLKLIKILLKASNNSPACPVHLLLLAHEANILQASFNCITYSWEDIERLRKLRPPGIVSLSSSRHFHDPRPLPRWHAFCSQLTHRRLSNDMWLLISISTVANLKFECSTENFVTPRTLSRAKYYFGALLFGVLFVMHGWPLRLSIKPLHVPNKRMCRKC